MESFMKTTRFMFGLLLAGVTLATPLLSQARTDVDVHIGLPLPVRVLPPPAAEVYVYPDSGYREYRYRDDRPHWRQAPPPRYYYRGHGYHNHWDRHDDRRWERERRHHDR